MSFIPVMAKLNCQHDFSSLHMLIRSSRNYFNFNVENSAV